jgi:hypothetical protein
MKTMKAAQNGLFAGEIYNNKKITRILKEVFLLYKFNREYSDLANIFPPIIIYFTFTNLKNFTFFGRTNKLDWDLGWIHSQEERAHNAKIVLLVKLYTFYHPIYLTNGN